MAEGYFIADDGSLTAELGAHVFATPPATRFNLTMQPPGRARIHDAGGGEFALAVTGQRLRDNLGDAERYAFELLAALAEADEGTLACQDSRGHQATFGDAVCLGAAARIRAYRLVEIDFDFAAPERETQPAWVGAPAAPATYGGTSTAQDYAAGGASLGVGGSMRIEMVRRAGLRTVPRCRSVRPSVPSAGAYLRLVVTAGLDSGTDHLAEAAQDLFRQVGPRPVDLVANGNTYENVVLDAFRTEHTDRRAAMVDWTFLAEVSG